MIDLPGFSNINFYALLPLASLLANLFLGCYIIYRDSESRLNRLYALTAFSLTIWSLGDLLTFTSLTPQSALFWAKRTTIGSAFTASFLFHFFLTFIRSEFSSRKIVYLLYLAAPILALVNLTTDLISVSAEPAYWGYYITRGFVYWVLAFYIMSCTAVGVALCFRFYLRSSSPEEKTQAKLLTVALGIPLIGGTISQIILPLFGFKVLPLSSTLTTLTAIIIAYAMVKYRLLTPLLFSIRDKLVAGFLVVSLLASAAGIVGTGMSQQALQESIGKDLVALAVEILDAVDGEVNSRIEEGMVLTKDPALRRAVLASNQKFEKLPDIQKYIDREEEAWRAAPQKEITPFMERLIKNEVSEQLRDKVKAYKSVAGYQVYGEMFVTNKYGANAVQTGKTSDYYQADEEWWQAAKGDGIYIGDVKYDESADVYSTDIGLRVNDKAGNFIGVMKLVLNIERVINVVKESERAEGHREGEFKLIDGRNRIIYSGEGYQFLEDVSEKEFLQKAIGDKGFLVGEGDLPGEGRELFAYARSDGYQSFTGLGWLLVAEYQTDDVFGPAADLRKIVLAISFAVMIFAVLVSLFIARSIYKPVVKLRDAVRQVGEGRLGVRIKVKTRDEIEELAKAFNDMASQLRRSYKELEKKVAEKTQAAAELEKAKAAVLNLLEDARELGKELKREKESVERKVEERTAELGREKSRLAASINSLSLGFIMTDARDNIVISNPAVERILGVKAHKLTLKKIAKEFAGKCDLLKSYVESQREKKLIELEEVPYGSKILRISLVPVITLADHKEVIGTVILIDDISEAKILERSKEEFFSIASHELRTPLTTIRGNTSLIKEYYGDVLKDQPLKEMISDIYDSSTRLIKIVNDFLDVSRLEQKRIEFEIEAFALPSLIAEVVKELRSIAAQKKLFLKIKKPKAALPEAFADRERTKQVLINIIGNAVSFTETGGATISIVREKGFLKVLVKDTGKGIPKERRGLLFRKFQQAGEKILTRDVTRGTGLGLYISKMLVEGMGGKIKLEQSEVGKGSTFSFTLPIAGS